MHQKHEDRYCFLFGQMEVVPYDERPASLRAPQNRA